MSRKFTIIIVSVLFLIFAISSTVFAQGGDDELNGFDAVFDGIFESREDLIDGLFFLSDYVNNITQVSQFTMLNTNSWSLGLIADVAFVNTVKIREIGGEAVSNAMDDIPLIGVAESYGVLPMANLYFAYKIPKNIPISLYIRGLWIPVSYITEHYTGEAYFDDFVMLGGGVSFDADELFPEKLNEETGEMEESIFKLKAILNYHLTSGIPFMNFHSIGIEVIGGLQLVEKVINPYLSIGWDTTIIDLSVDLWSVYDAWFNTSGTEIPTRTDIQDYFNDSRVPGYAKEQIEKNIEEGYGGEVRQETNGDYIVDDWGSATDEDAQDILTINDLLGYPAHIPFSLGVQFRFAVFHLGVEYSSNLINLFNFRDGSISLTLGLGF